MSGHADIPLLGERHTLVNWVREGEDGRDAPMIDMARYSELLTVLPDKVVENLERARLARDGRVPMLKAGLGYEELLSAIIVDGSAIASSSTENFLAPAFLLPANYLQPGGLPGRTLRLIARGRVTTLTTGATMIFKIGHAATNVIPTTPWATSGAMVCDATAQTNTQWSVICDINVRSVGSSGTVFAQGEANFSPHSQFTAANYALKFMGSAGSAAPSTATVDMTTAIYFSLTGKWSLATAYSIQAHQLELEALN